MGTEIAANASGSIAPQLTEALEEEAESALDDAMSRAETAEVSYGRVTREGDSCDVIAPYCGDRGSISSPWARAADRE